MPGNLIIIWDMRTEKRFFPVFALREIFRLLENCGIDSDEYSGFAFGIGIERTAMLKYGINNIKLLFESDLRVLEQLND